MVSTAPRGASRLGCLLLVVLLAAAAYFAVNIGEVYYRYYRFRDAMSQQARFAPRISDDVVQRRLRATADSLGLPEAAGNVFIRRSPGLIELWSEYYEHIELPLFVRELHFTPSAEHAF